MFRNLMRKRTHVPLDPRSDGFVPDASFWRALELVMGQYLDEEPRHHDGPLTDLYELTVCKSLCTQITGVNKLGNATGSENVLLSEFSSVERVTALHAFYSTDTN